MCSLHVGKISHHSVPLSKLAHISVGAIGFRAVWHVFFQGLKASFSAQPPPPHLTVCLRGGPPLWLIYVAGACTSPGSMKGWDSLLNPAVCFSRGLRCKEAFPARFQPLLSRVLVFVFFLKKQTWQKSFFQFRDHISQCYCGSHGHILRVVRGSLSTGQKSSSTVVILPSGFHLLCSLDNVVSTQAHTPAEVLPCLVLSTFRIQVQPGAVCT